MTLRLIGLLFASINLSLACSSSSEPSSCEFDDQCLPSQQCSADAVCENRERDEQDSSDNEGELIVTGADGVNAGEMNAGEMNAGEVSAGEVSAGEMTAGEVSAGEVSAGEVSAGEMNAGEVSAGAVSAGEVSAGEMNAGEMNAGEMNAGEMNAGEVFPQVPPCETTLCLELVMITDDLNDDGVLSPGESAILNYFIIRNNSTEDIEGLTGHLSSDNPYLTFRTERLRFTPGSSHRYVSADNNRDNSDRLCPAEDDCGQATSIRFEISPNAPIGEEVIIEFDLSDELGRVYHLEYPLLIVENDVNLELTELVVTRDRNNDDRLSPGESATLSYFKLINTGTSNIIDLSGLISSNSPYLNFITERLSFTPGSSHRFYNSNDNYDNSDGECPAGGDCGQATSIHFELTPNAPIGESIMIEFDLFDRLNNEYHFEYPLLIEAADINLDLFEVIITGSQAIDGLSPGESAVLNYFSIRNTGSTDATGLNGLISSGSPDLNLRTERLNFTPGSSHSYSNELNNQDNNDGTCLAFDDCGQATDIRFSISENAVPGQVVNIIFDITDDLDNVFRLAYPVPVR